MIIPQGISHLSQSVLSYIITALTILAIVKFIQMIMSMGGGIGGLFKGGGGGGSKPPKTNPPDGGGGGGDGGGAKPPGWREKLETGIENPGKISFHIRNLDDGNVKGAELTMWTTKRTKWFRKGKGVHGRTYKDVSNADGIIPSNGKEWLVPSVSYKVQVTYKLSKHEKYLKEKNQLTKYSWARELTRRFEKSTITQSFDIDIRPEENERRSIQLAFHAEENTGFEPFIKSITYDKDKQELKTQGIINRV
jgi:hypothetical protein